MKYLFKEWETVRKKFKGRRLLLFLDFDGTVVPIARTPDKVVLPDESAALLSKLARSPKADVAFISGRSLKDVRRRVGLRGVVYSGNHGLEIRGKRINFTVSLPSGYHQAVKKISNILKRKASSVPGAFVEDKGLSLSLHYRLADKKRVPGLRSAFYAAVASFLSCRKVRVRPGKMVLELRPAVDWDKGSAVSWILRRQTRLPGGRNIFPFYLGDDLTDRDAFRALKGKGITVSVGRNKRLCADYYLKNQSEVVEFLRRIYGELR